MNGKQKVLQVVSNLKITLKERKLWCTLLNVYDKLELLDCLTKIVCRIFLEGGKSKKKKVSHCLEVLGSQTGFPKGLEKNLKFQRGGVNNFGIQRAWGMG